MRFADINGNADTLRALSGMIQSGRIPHALMFIEPDGGPAFSIAMAYLQMLYCQQRTAGDSCGGSCSDCGACDHGEADVPDLEAARRAMAARDSE